MKLIRFGPGGQEKPGVIRSDGIRIDVSGFINDYDESFFGSSGIDRLAMWASTELERAPTVPESVRLGPPIARPSKIVCVGLNYRDHAREAGIDIPSEPVLFFKASSAVCGPYDDVVIPKNSTKTDWEVELAIVIGTKATDVSKESALSHVGGYVLHNDYSERDYQFEHAGQWVKGKSCDTFAPLGPFLVTPDEIQDVGNLDMWLRVNGELRQQSNTSEMVFDVPSLISYISRFMTLLPGDVISTGTPSGVGLGLKPPVYLKDGDIVELGIDSLGVSRQQASSHS